MQNEREQLLKIAQKLIATGLNKGTAGNVSVRCQENGQDGFLITPSGMEVEDMRAASIVKMQFDGSYEAEKIPSSEWRFHRDILASRADINAVVHTTACSPPRWPACTKTFRHFTT